MSTPAFSWSAFILVISIMASWQLTYAPYVADYSRYLPSNTSTSATFWWTYLGSVISSSWMMVLGAIAAIAAPKQSADMVGYLGHLAGHGLDFVAYILAVLVQFPFMNTQLHVGVIAKHMGGADIAWIVGLVVAASIYYFPMRGRIAAQMSPK